MLTSKISSKSQITLPAEVRAKLGLAPGDRIVYEIEGNEVRVSKLAPFDAEFHKALESTLSEWNSAEDEEAFSDL